MKLITRDNRLEVWQHGELIAYVEDDTLFVIVAGYAEQIGTVDHASEVIEKVKTWSAQSK